MKRILSIFVTIYLVILTALGQQKSWTADNGMVLIPILCFMMNFLIRI